MDANKEKRVKVKPSHASLEAMAKLNGKAIVELTNQDLQEFTKEALSHYTYHILEWYRLMHEGNNK